MGAPRSLDASTDRLPKSMLAAQGQNLDWKQHSKCRDGNRGDVPHFAWLVDAKDRGASLLGRPAEAWIALALAECRNCPVQYDCARFAIEVGEDWGTWSMDIVDLKKLRKRPDRMVVIDVAEEQGIPVQVAVRAVHDRHAMRLVG